MSGTLAGDLDGASSKAEIMLRLWPQPASCADARHAVRAFCNNHALPHLAYDAELLTSELVTNAIEHSGTLITLVALCDRGELIVSIRDDDAGSAAPVVALADPAAESGRGIHLIDTIAGAWGTKQHADGKSVWFRLP